MGPLIPLFWTSGDICPGFQSQGGFLAYEPRAGDFYIYIADIISSVEPIQNSNRLGKTTLIIAVFWHCVL